MGISVLSIMMPPLLPCMEILFASHSERYSKKKNDPDLHHALIRDAIRYSGTPDIIAWYEKPVLKKLRQLRAGQFDLAFDRRELPKNYLKDYPQLKNVPIKYQSHHYTHAASVISHHLLMMQL